MDVDTGDFSSPDSSNSPALSDSKDGSASHKIIEKRRRDRINSCLLELSNTVPAAFAKQASGKLEKAEILEMTVQYLKTMQATESAVRLDKGEWYTSDIWGDLMQQYHQGYSECMREVARYLGEMEGITTGDTRSVRMLSYLQTRFRTGARPRHVQTHPDSLLPNRVDVPAGLHVRARTHAQMGTETPGLMHATRERINHVGPVRTPSAPANSISPRGIPHMLDPIDKYHGRLAETALGTSQNRGLSYAHPYDNGLQARRLYQHQTMTYSRRTNDVPRRTFAGPPSEPLSFRPVTKSHRDYGPLFGLSYP